MFSWCADSGGNLWWCLSCVLLLAGALFGCTDSDAQCTILQPVPQPGSDYRGKPRVVTSAGGVVAADQSRCSDIGADVLKVSDWMGAAPCSPAWSCTDVCVSWIVPGS